MVVFASGYPPVYIATLGNTNLHDYFLQEDGAYLLTENGQMLEMG
jgi:hypothetical protein